MDEKKEKIDEKETEETMEEAFTLMVKPIAALYRGFLEEGLDPSAAVSLTMAMLKVGAGAPQMQDPTEGIG